MPNWNEVLKEVHRGALEGQMALDMVRRKYLGALHRHTNRNVIAYYSGFLSKPGILQSEISDEDKNGLMMAVHKLERNKGLDLLLHTQGGSVAATQSIVDYLRKMFGKNIRAIVPQIAMSAGTMIACSCKSILMAKHSNLGPIDPHLRAVPAYGVIQEFERACREIKKDRSRIAVWQPILAQYKPTFLGQCENAIKWSNKFVEDQLAEVMFEGRPEGRKEARGIVKKLTDYTGNKTHERHIHMEECSKMGLVVEAIEDDAKLQDLVLTIHHSYMHVFMNTAAYKIIENHLGHALVKNQATLSK